jgi:hypothetical protein
MATKKALIVGLNYPGTKKALKCGVVNARKVKKYLEKYLQFQPEHITLLTDEVKFVQIEAFDICKQLYMMIKDAKDDDILKTITDTLILDIIYEYYNLFCRLLFN